MTRNKVPTKGAFIVKVALIFATPTSVVFCGLFWKFGALSLGSAFALIGLCAAVGFGYAAFVHKLVEKRITSTKDGR
jgi:uncharacterized membrane protein